MDFFLFSLVDFHDLKINLNYFQAKTGHEPSLKSSKAVLMFVGNNQAHKQTNNQAHKQTNKTNLEVSVNKKQELKRKCLIPKTFSFSEHFVKKEEKNKTNIIQDICGMF